MDCKELSSGIRTVVMMAILAILLSFMCGCKTTKKSLTEKTETRDSVRIEYREKIVKVPVVVEVEVPVEKVSNITNDTTSHLETSFAVSNASMVWIDGVPFLRHDLENKAQKIQKKDSVPVTEKEKTMWNTRRVTYNKTEIREKQLTWWQKGLMWTGGIGLIIFSFIIVIWLVKWLLRRKP